MAPHGTPEGFARAFSQQELDALSLLDDPTSDQVNYARITENLQIATGVINSYMPPNYQQLASVDGKVLEHICYEIARWFLDKNMQRESVKDRYEAALKLLEKLAKDAQDGTLGNTGGVSGGSNAFDSGTVGLPENSLAAAAEAFI